MEISDTLAQCRYCISYTPLNNEVSPEKYLVFPNPSFVIPSDRNTDPFSLANEVSERFKSTNVCILIPGKHFDIYGTRHGRGGGWYDRFLSKIPSKWLRVGLLYKKQLSDKRLERKPWDQPMDVLAIVENNTVQFFSITK